MREIGASFITNSLRTYHFQVSKLSLIQVSKAAPENVLKEENMEKQLTPVKAIRAKCIDCCCGEKKEVRECNMAECPLWPYRMGKRPTVVETVGKEG